jgi:hypothetical protein
MNLFSTKLDYELPLKTLVDDDKPKAIDAKPIKARSEEEDNDAWSEEEDEDDLEFRKPKRWKRFHLLLEDDEDDLERKHSEVVVMEFRKTDALNENAGGDVEQSFGLGVALGEGRRGP